MVTTLTLLKVTAQLFCGMSLHSGFIGCSLWPGQVTHLWYTEQKGCCALFRVCCRVAHFDMSLSAQVHSDHLVKVPFSRHFHCEIALFPFVIIEYSVRPDKLNFQFTLIFEISIDSWFLFYLMG